MLTDALNWLTSPDAGAFVVVSWALSWALEEVDWWHTLSPKGRSAIVLVISAVLAVGAVALRQNPGHGR